MRPASRRRDRFRAHGLADTLLNGTVFGKALALSRARARVRARTGGHYPAPVAAIDVIERTSHLPLANGLEIEASRVSDLVIGPVCKNLVRIFQLTEAAKKEPVGRTRARAAPGAASGAGGSRHHGRRHRRAGEPERHPGADARPESRGHHARAPDRALA